MGSEDLSVEAVSTLCHIIPHFQTGESLLGWLCQLLVICLGWGNYSPFFCFVLLSLLRRYFILLLTKWLSVDLECKYLCIFMHPFTVKVISRAVCQTLEWTVGLIRLYWIWNMPNHALSCLACLACFIYICIYIYMYIYIYVCGSLFKYRQYKIVFKCN